MDAKAIELAQLIAQRKHDTGTPEYTLAVALLEYHAVLEEAGETNDGEYRLCCISRISRPHSATCCIGKALNYTVPDRE